MRPSFPRNHVITINFILGIAIVVGVLPGRPGCSSSCGEALSTGRSVEVTSDTFFVSATRYMDGSSIDLGGSQVVVQPKRIAVEGVEATMIDQRAQNVSLCRRRGAIVAHAEGKKLTTRGPSDEYRYC